MTTYTLTATLKPGADSMDVARGLSIGLEHEWLDRTSDDRAWDAHGVTHVEVTVPDDNDRPGVYKVSIDHASGDGQRSQQLADAIRGAAERLTSYDPAERDPAERHHLHLVGGIKAIVGVR